jgi:hypothetical protein
MSSSRRSRWEQLPPKDAATQVQPANAQHTASTSAAVERAAFLVSIQGAAYEETLRLSATSQPQYAFMLDASSAAYLAYRQRLREILPAEAHVQRDRSEGAAARPAPAPALVPPVPVLAPVPVPVPVLPSAPAMPAAPTMPSVASVADGGCYSVAPGGIGRVFYPPSVLKQQHASRESHRHDDHRTERRREADGEGRRADHEGSGRPREKRRRFCEEDEEEDGTGTGRSEELRADDVDDGSASTRKQGRRRHFTEED